MLKYPFRLSRESTAKSTAGLQSGQVVVVSQDGVKIEVFNQGLKPRPSQREMCTQWSVSMKSMTSSFNVCFQSKTVLEDSMTVCTGWSPICRISTRLEFCFGHLPIEPPTLGCIRQRMLRLRYSRKYNHDNILGQDSENGHLSDGMTAMCSVAGRSPQ